jgi:hypothetical protein
MERVKRVVQQSFDSHRNLWGDRSFVLNVIFGVVLLLVAFVINYFAQIFALHSVSNPVTDIILDNTRVWDVTFVFVYGVFIFWGFMGVMLIIEPKRTPFLLKSLALFVVIRSIFITMTHLAPFATHLELPIDNVLSLFNFSFGADFFFSAHTGGPFLAALVFWDHKYVRYFCLVASVFFGVIVLLSHLHYSIDVFGAFFITYSIYHMAVYFFKRDFALIAEYDNTKL